MTDKQYNDIEKHMLLCMTDSAHDAQHVYRVLCMALQLAADEICAVDYDVLITACLLHDIGRDKQNHNPEVCHAKAGAEMANVFLLDKGYGEDFADHVASCIKSHRYRADSPPKSIEARLLFDADKLEAAGAIGIARTLLYQGRIGTGIYDLDDNGNVLGEDGQASFMHEYHYKLKKVYNRFYTQRARAIAQQRRQTAEAYVSALTAEIEQAHSAKKLFKAHVEAELEVLFPAVVEDAEIEFAVIVAWHKGQIVLVRHRERASWEVPGGHREAGETPVDTANRELFEETGALKYSLSEICPYGVKRGENITYGMLFEAEVEAFGPLPQSEIAEVCMMDELPAELTYPLIQPLLVKRIKGII